MERPFPVQDCIEKKEARPQDRPRPFITIYGLNVEKFLAPGSKAIFERMHNERPDIICLQETGDPVTKFPDYARLDRHGYCAYDNYELQAPEAGVAIFSRYSSTIHNSEFCNHCDCRGRFVEILIGDLRISSVYAYAHPTKGNKESAERRKRSRVQFYACLGSYMRASAGDRGIVVTDLNVALTYADVANSRQWSGPWANGGGGAYRSAVVAAFRGPSPWGDSFRVVHGCHERRATVWCPSTFAAKDGAEQGFGIDYQLVSNSVRGKVVDAAVVKPPTWGQRFSDHALTIGRYDISEILADY